eukprot:Skav227343  [mRNA]  locus=scaffold1665:39021:39545:+ [translate_table: standard]
MEKRTKAYALKLAEVKKLMKEMEKEQGKLSRAQKKKDDYEEKKKTAKQDRERGITIHINYQGHTYVMTVQRNITVGMLRRRFAMDLGIPPKQVQRLSFTFQGTVITNNPRKLLHSFGIDHEALIDTEMGTAEQGDNDETESISISIRGGEVEIEGMSEDEEDDSDDDKDEDAEL